MDLQLYHVTVRENLASLRKALQKEKLERKVGIGHTRWATHGVLTISTPTHNFLIRNNLCLVHNGIIENYSRIKESLFQKGYEFHSDTDTEVLINLIEFVKEKENVKLGEAVQIALQQVVGAYAIAVMDNNKPDEIVVAKLGSPLCIGVGKGEHFIGSDATPFLEFWLKK